MARPVRALAGAAAAGLILAMLQGCGAGSADWYKAQLDAKEKAKPILELIPREGEDIKISGVKSLRVYGESANAPLAPYRDPWAPVFRDALGLLGIVGSTYVAGENAVNLAETVGRHAGGNISGSLNAGGQAAVQYAPGGGAGMLAAPQANPSWVNDDHSSRTEGAGE